MENQEKKEVLIYQNEIWQDGYESAIIDLRFRLAQAYSANNRNAIRDMIMYLYRKIDFNVSAHLTPPHRIKKELFTIL